MNKLYLNKDYVDDVQYVAGLDLDWAQLKDKRVFLSGATGLIGSFFVDVLNYKNRSEDLNCTIYALTRNVSKAKDRFSEYANDQRLIFVEGDVTDKSVFDDLEKMDFILHLASNTHPVQYSTDPIGTIMTNVTGLSNMLELAVKSGAKRFAFASSIEIYGENRGDKEIFDEEYCGYINCNTMRAGYPESKRCGEALCQAYKAQKGLDVVIPRLPRCYGPTMLQSDTKAISQFIKKAIAGEDIVLKSAGTQFYSYQYVADSVSGLLVTLLQGENGEAYNIAEESSDIMLKDLASVIAKTCGKKVVFEIPDAVEAAGYSKATKARMDGGKLMTLGWKPRYDVKTGIERTIKIFQNT